MVSKVLEKEIKFHLPQAIMDLSCWHYEYYDLIEKKINRVKSTRHIVISMVEIYFFYDENNKYHAGFNETDRLLISTFIHDKKFKVDLYHGDLNVILTFDYIKSLQWFGTSSKIIYDAMNEIVTNKKKLA